MPLTEANKFARQLVADDSTLLNKRNILADRVAQSLKQVRSFKRGGKKPPAASTVLKALANVFLG